MLKDQFVQATKAKTVGGVRGLPGTAELTSVASNAANEILRKLNENTEAYQEKLAASKVDHNAMDSLVRELYDLDAVDVSFLQRLSEDDHNAMLKSQQSKRSRCKSKVMTLDNYHAMLTGAVAELLLRKVMGKEKSAMGYRRAAGAIEYSSEELEAFRNDQEALRREIRNVQSKKSIAKSKANFDENSERWQQLLEAERLLKSLRVSNVRTVEVDRTKELLLAELGEQNLSELKPSDAKKLLQKVLGEATSEAASEVASE